MAILSKFIFEHCALNFVKTNTTTQTIEKKTEKPSLTLYFCCCHAILSYSSFKGPGIHFFSVSSENSGIMRSNNRLLCVAFIVFQTEAGGSKKNGSRKSCHIKNKKLPSALFLKHLKEFQSLRNIVYFSSILLRAIFLSTLECIGLWSSLRKKNCKATRSFNFSEQQKLRESRNEYKWLSYVAIKRSEQSLD